AKAAILSGSRGQRTASMPALAGVATGRYAASAALTAPPTASPPARGDTLGGVVVGPFPEDHYPPERRRIWPWLLLIAALLCLIGGGLAAYLLTRPSKLVVPAVTGEQFNVAQAQLQNDGFNVNEIQLTSQKKAGTVIAKDPQAGAKAKKNTTVTLNVSTGPGNATVPSVVGETLGQAKSAIQIANLKVGRVEHQSSTTVHEGQVIGTSPPAGATPGVNTPVTIIVSTGPPPVAVPDVTSETVGQAKAQLQSPPGQFVVTTTEQVSTTVAPGTVISQSPVGGSSLKPGSAIDLIVAKAPPTFAVPNVVGSKRGAAEATLGASGFPATVQRMDVTTKSQGGVVLSQTPAAGTMSKKGATVTIVVGHYVAPTPTTTTTTTAPNTTTSTTSTTGTTTTPTP
ncbi:MAG: PASTA domain-containing protein, partial [Solirubrobacteraceae bacterium]